MSNAPKISKKNGGLGRIKTRATAKATAPATPTLAPTAALGDDREKTTLAKEVTSPPLPRQGSGDVTNLLKVSVPQAVQAQKAQLEKAGAKDLFIDFTDTDGGQAARIRTSLYLSTEAIEALYELQTEESARYGKAPKLYHYIELALLKFMPTATEAAAQTSTETPTYEPVSTAVSKEAKVVMRSTRKVKNATGRPVAKHWYYSQAIVRMAAARRRALNL